MNRSARIVPYSDGTVSLPEVVDYLHLAWPQFSTELWTERLRHWWAENPFSTSESFKGYAAMAGDEMVGFGGTIPTYFAWQGEKVPGIYATSFHVDPRYPGAAAKIFLSQRDLMEKHVVIHATPMPRIQTALLKMGGYGLTEMTCHYLALGTLSRLNGRSGWPVLDARQKIVTCMKDVVSLARPYQRADRLEKWTTVESLKWYCSSPMRQHHLIGTTDSEGKLTSYMIIADRRRRGLATWDVVETFTTRDDQGEIMALLGTLVQSPDLLPGKRRLLTVTQFDSEPDLTAMPVMTKRTEQVCHYFLLPQRLQNIPKHTVPTEGDFGL